MRIALNGYGRIGRCVRRAVYENNLQDEIEIVAINDLSSIELLTHLTRVDSVHGHFNAEVSNTDNSISVNGHEIKIYQQADPATLPWRNLEIDLVLECTGKMKSHAKCDAHIQAGAPRVLVAYPVADADTTLVYGVNHQQLSVEHKIISNASCTTNCLAPIAKILNDSLGIEQGIITTIHAYTNGQQLLDKAPGDIYRSRSATQSMIPTRTGAAAAVGLVLPELAGKLSGMAVRIPTPNVSLVDFHFVAKRDTSVEEINKIVKEAATSSTWKGIVAYNEQPFVSIDFNHHPASSIFDANHTSILNRQARVISWYDNEWGFSNRMLDMARYIQQQTS